MNEDLWNSLNTQEARTALYQCHSNDLEMDKLKKFISTVELLKKKYVKQVPMLLKEGNND